MNKSMNSHLTIREFIDLLPRKVSVATVAGWMNHGVCGERLESIRVAGRRLIPREAAEIFLARIVKPVKCGA